MAEVSINEIIRCRAILQGYTELRFNPETMSWAWHKPDQAVGEDGRLYVWPRAR